jgi:4-amino-4-deoxy-L-arabinose transferase-like glycosyltransferase
MRQDLRHQAWIAMTAVAVLFTNLGATRLWDQDEAFFARTAVEMHQRGEWIVPYFNGELFAHKPPLMFWFMRIGYLLFGVTEFAARFWSAVFGVATALLVYRLGRRMFSARVGLWAGLAISTSLMFDVVGRAATPDSFLVFFSTLALWIFARCETWSDEAGSTEFSSPPRLSWQTCAAMYAVMAIAVLVKGPIGLLLPGAVLGLYLLVRGRAGMTVANDVAQDRILLLLRRVTPARIVRTVWAMRPLTAVAVVLLIAGPWFAAVGWQTGGAFLYDFFGVQNFGRFVGAMDNHSGGIWYYVPAILVGFFPWTIFAAPTVLDMIRRCRGKLPGSDGAKFLCCWILVYVGFFSIAATKLPNYVLPAYPALALATACFLDRWLTRPDAVSHWWPRLAFGSLLAIGVAAIVAPVVLFRDGNGQKIVERLGIAPELRSDMLSIAWLGALLVAAAAAGLIFLGLRKPNQAFAALTITATAFCLTLFSWLAVRIDRLQPCPAVAQAIQNHSTGMPQVAQFGYFRPSLVYYCDTRVETCRNALRVADFLESNDNVFVVTTEEHFARLSPHLPGDVAVIDQLPEFPRQGTVLILSRKNPVALRNDERIR